MYSMCCNVRVKYAIYSIHIQAGVYCKYMHKKLHCNCNNTGIVFLQPLAIYLQLQQFYSIMTSMTLLKTRMCTAKSCSRINSCLYNLTHTHSPLTVHLVLHCQENFLRIFRVNVLLCLYIDRKYSYTVNNITGQNTVPQRITFLLEPDPHMMQNLFKFTLYSVTSELGPQAKFFFSEPEPH
jgi:hypothetical protein